MSYSNSPLLPKARRQAVNLVLKEGFGFRRPPGTQASSFDSFSVA